MNNQEVYLSSRQRRALKFTAQGIANAKIIAKEYGCVGPAFRSFSDGLDRQVWQEADDSYIDDSDLRIKKILSPASTTVAIINHEYADALGTQIKFASLDNRLGISEMENQALSLGHYAAARAFTNLPSFIEPGYDPLEAPDLDLLSDFYSTVTLNHPEVVDGSTTESALIDLHTRFASTLANSALMIELEKRHYEGAINVIDELELADKAEYNADPFPQNLIRDLIANQSLTYNLSYYKIN